MSFISDNQRFATQSMLDAGISAFFLHLCGGIRHLVWDTVHGFELRSIYISGWTVVAVSIVLTAAAWTISPPLRVPPTSAARRFWRTNPQFNQQRGYFRGEKPLCHSAFSAPADAKRVKAFEIYRYDPDMIARRRTVARFLISRSDAGAELTRLPLNALTSNQKGNCS
jgi:Succinate dehydrogenase/Fumarate reductase transmembrane subunit